MPQVPPNEMVLKIATGLEGRVPGLAGLSERLQKNQCTEQDFEAARKLYEHPQSSEAVRERIQLLGTEIRARMRQVQQESPDPEQNDDAGLTLGKMDNSFRKSGVEFLQGPIFSFIKKEHSNPDFMSTMVKGLENSPERSVASLFVNLSAGGRSLLPPLHLVGQALIYARPKISRWVQENANGELRSFFTKISPQDWLHERFGYLEESVRVEQAKISASELLETFEKAFTSKNRELLANAQKQLGGYFNYHAHNRQLYQQTISFITQMIASSRVLTDAQNYLTKGLIDTFARMNRSESSEDAVTQEMFVAIDTLRAKQLRMDASHSAPTQAAQKPVKKQVPAKKPPAQVILPPDKNAVRGKVQEIMRLPDQKKAVFVNCLKAALKPCAHRLAIDSEKSSFRVLGSGGTCVVIELHDSTMNKPFAARFDIESLGEGEDAEYATQLAMRAFAIHSRLNHHSIVKHIGFDSIAIAASNKPGAPSVTITFQKLELIDRALTGLSIIESLKEQKTIPQSEDILELMHKMIEPIHFMHQMGIVHRDIKPENMMIIPPRDWKGDLHTLMKKGTLKFLDIGLARQVTLPEGGATFSAASIIPGTLPFIAPECFLDGTKTRDTKNDVYALGITFYHFITGQNDEHAYNVSRGEKVDFRNQNYVIGSMGALAADVEDKKNVPSVVSINDPGIQRFLQQNHGGKTGKIRAQKIVDFIIRMCDPNPDNRPDLNECMAFTESDGMVLQRKEPQGGGVMKRMFGWGK